MKEGLIKISKLAKDLGVTVTTLYNWRKKGDIEFIQSHTGRNFVTLQTYNKYLGIKQKKQQKVVIYCRVSSSVNKDNLQTQKQRVLSYCYAKGYKIHNIICQIGSGINDKRSKLQRLLEDGDYTKIVVQHKDRLTRMGYNYIQVLLKKDNKEIEVINTVQTIDQDIIQDFVSIITSYCAKIYGTRRSKRKTEKLIKQLKNN